VKKFNLHENWAVNSYFYTSPLFEYFFGLTIGAHERIAIPACSLVINRIGPVNVILRKARQRKIGEKILKKQEFFTSLKW